MIEKYYLCYKTNCPNVLECNCITGYYSILIKVAFESTSELDGFIGKLQDYGSTETQIVFSTVVPPRSINVMVSEESQESIS